jgi:hypothetical protein
MEIKDFARSILEDPTYQTRLKQRLLDGDAPQIEQLLYHYLYGKPRQELELTRRELRVIVNRGGAMPLTAEPQQALESHSMQEG